MVFKKFKSLGKKKKDYILSCKKRGFLHNRYNDIIVKMRKNVVARIGHIRPIREDHFFFLHKGALSLWYYRSISSTFAFKKFILKIAASLE